MNPTQQISFETDDKLGLSEFAEKLEAFIEIERHFISGSLVMSLNAPFGSGKSMFLQMWKNSLLERRKKNEFLPIPIIINTWESDHCGDPLLALISSLSRELNVYGTPKATLETIRDAAKDAVWFGIGLANSIVSEATGVDAIAAGELAEKKKSVGKVDMLTEFENRSAALLKLKDSLAQIFSPGKSRAILMIDELDRCRPDYAVEFLEAIKHVFDTNEITFVLAVDKSQLSSSVQALFGAGMVFDEYYRKFAHRNISLPTVNSETAPKLINHYWQTIVTHSQFRPPSQSYAKFDQIAVNTLQELTACFKLTPRQAHEMFRILGHILSKKNDRGGNLYWGYSICSMFMAVMSVGAVPLYHNIGNRRANFDDVSKNILAMLLNKDHGNWWTRFLICCGAFNETDHGVLLQKAKAVGLLSETKDADHLKLQIRGDFSEAWGPRGRSFPLEYVYSRIETLRNLDS